MKGLVSLILLVAAVLMIIAMATRDLEPLPDRTDPPPEIVDREESDPLADIEPILVRIEHMEKLDQTVLWRQIPIGSIYSTHTQEGLKLFPALRLGGRDVSAFWAAIDPLRKANKRFALLLPGEDLAAAVRAVPARIRDEPDALEPNDTGQHWLFVYLGEQHISPPMYVPRSVTIDHRTIRVIYDSPEPEIILDLLVAHGYWIPLGRLEPGDYVLDFRVEGFVTFGWTQEVRVSER